jgi:hypothetical protein
METQTKIIIATLLFSALVVMANYHGSLGIVGEVLVLFYFIGLLSVTYYKRKYRETYPYLAVIYFFLLVGASTLGDEKQSILYSIFFFYTLVSILLFTIFEHFKLTK